MDNDKEKMYGAADYTCYEGREIEGKIDLVMQRGKILVKTENSSVKEETVNI